MARHKSDTGQALILFAFTMVVLMGFAGMGIDMGYLRYMRRSMQAATDSAAVAGAAEVQYGDVTAAARKDAATDGFTNGVRGATVTVNNPPLSGPHKGNSGYVEVIVSQVQPTFFMKVLGINSHTVSTRAVGYSGASGACIYSIDPTVSAAFSVSGGANLDAKCGILDNSNNDKAALVTNGGGCLTAKYIGVVGQFKNDSNCAPSPIPVSGIAPFSDPLAYLQPPSVGACQYNSVSFSGGTHTLYPGTYCGGISISGGSTEIYFSPGTYIINGGGLNVSGGANIDGNGVFFYLTGTSTSFKGLSITGGSNSELIAPSSGTYRGILFFQDRAISGASSGANSTIAGGSGLTVQGTLYFPTTTLNYSGTSTNAAYTILVADVVKITNNTYFPDTYTTDPNGFSPIHSAILVE